MIALKVLKIMPFRSLKISISIGGHFLFAPKEVINIILSFFSKLLFYKFRKKRCYCYFVSSNLMYVYYNVELKIYHENHKI